MRTVVALILILCASPAVAASEAQIRRDCTSDALSYCWRTVLTANRSNIIRCMVKNKDRLQPRCRAHFR